MLNKHILVSFPSFRYTFGNGDTPFYTALKEQSDRNMYPWQWHNMKQKYSYARSIINLLANEKYYEFTLTGQFEDVHGVRADLQWKNLNRKREITEWEPTLEQDVPKEDPKRVFPHAPKVQATVKTRKILPVCLCYRQSCKTVKSISRAGRAN